MKQLILLPLFVLFFLTASAQGVSINTNGNPPDSSAILDVSSTTKGFLPPRMTQVQRDAINNPAIGLTIFNTTTDCMNMWTGSTWRQSCFDCDFSAPNVSNNGPICEGNTLQLTAASLPGATYSWTGPNGFTSNQQSPSISNATAAAGGLYSLEVTLNGCTASPVTTAATVNATPATPTAGNNGPICVGNSLDLTASTIPGASYSWTGPNGFSSNAQNPNVSGSASPSMTGTYSVTATVNGCVSNIGTTNATVNALPSGGTATPTNSTVCTGQTTTINLAGSSGSIQWEESSNNMTFTTVAGGSGSTTTSYTTAALSSTTYFRALLTSNGCTSYSDTVTITIQSGSASGGSVTTSGPWTIHTFTSNGTFNPGPCVSQVEYLIVGGGGGGGDGNAGGGAGGAGGFVEGVVSVTNQNYSVVVGAGGQGSQCQDCIGSPGQNSSFAGITANGGGRGGGYAHRTGGNGGSGGGAAGPGGAGGNGGGSSNQSSPVGGTGYGNSGTAYNNSSGGGGGGAGGPAVGADGGPGRSSSISGSAVFYAGGGGGASFNGPIGQGGTGGGGNGGNYPGAGNGFDGQANTGGGGGGSGDGPIGGDGGSGIVIIRYQ